MPVAAVSTGSVQEKRCNCSACRSISFCLRSPWSGVALLHHYTLYVALAGLAVITGYKLAFTGFKFGAGFAGLTLHLQHEWVILANLFLLLMGFALLSRHFEESRVPDEMPAFLPDDWKGGLVLLVVVFVLSSFLDNIAAALDRRHHGAARVQRKVHIGYLAAIVAASNAGGAGSVVGDTTTTMMWIDGVSPLAVLHAYVAAGVGAADFRHSGGACSSSAISPIVKDAPKGLHIEWTRAVHRRCHPDLRDRRQRHRQPEVSGTARCRAVDRHCGMGGHSRRRRRCGGPIGRCCRRPSRARSFCWRW